MVIPGWMNLLKSLICQKSSHVVAILRKQIKLIDKKRKPQQLEELVLIIPGNQIPGLFIALFPSEVHLEVHTNDYLLQD
jgi:hypothetical protein